MLTRRERMKKMSPLLKQCWKTGRNKWAESPIFLPHSSMAASIPTPFEEMDSRMGTGGAKSLPLKVKIRFMTTWGIWMYRIYRNTYQSLQELADVFTKPLFMIFWQSAHIPGGWKKGNILPIFSNPRKQDHGNYLLVSLVSVSGRIRK